MDKDEFTKFMETEIEGRWPDYKITKARLADWWKIVCHRTYEDAVQGIQNYSMVQPWKDINIKDAKKYIWAIQKKEYKRECCLQKEGTTQFTHFVAASFRPISDEALRRVAVNFAQKCSRMYGGNWIVRIGMNSKEGKNVSSKTQQR